MKIVKMPIENLEIYFHWPDRSSFFRIYPRGVYLRRLMRSLPSGSTAMITMKLQPREEEKMATKIPAPGGQRTEHGEEAWTTVRDKVPGTVHEGHIPIGAEV